MPTYTQALSVYRRTHAVIHGEVDSVITATGSFFSDGRHPQPVWAVRKCPNRAHALLISRTGTRRNRDAVESQVDLPGKIRTLEHTFSNSWSKRHKPDASELHEAVGSGASNRSEQRLEERNLKIKKKGGTGWHRKLVVPPISALDSISQRTQQRRGTEPLRLTGRQAIFMKTGERSATNDRTRFKNSTRIHHRQSWVSFEEKFRKIRTLAEFTHTSLSEAMTHELNQPLTSMPLTNWLHVHHWYILKEAERKRISRLSK